jgi:hypothetical protein
VYFTLHFSGTCNACISSLINQSHLSPLLWIYIYIYITQSPPHFVTSYFKPRRKSSQVCFSQTPVIVSLYFNFCNMSNTVSKLVGRKFVEIEIFLHSFTSLGFSVQFSNCDSVCIMLLSRLIVVGLKSTKTMELRN